MAAIERALDWVTSLMTPTAITSAVVYGSLGLVSTLIYTVAFFSIVSTHYRDTPAVVPPAKAAAATLTLMAPVAAMFLGLGWLGRSHELLFVFAMFPPAHILFTLCGIPLLLSIPAAALTAYPPFRRIHMPARPPCAPVGVAPVTPAVAKEPAAAAKKED
ncbi:hypothetical protein ABPG75_003945 [Micractinium tetrahymenae]